MFKDLVVIELASVLAGPSVGQFFAELGAEVIKVENKLAGGDVTRKWLVDGENPEGGVSAYYSSVNWGKESHFLDITAEEDYKKVIEWVKEADIVISSFKPGDDKKLKVDFKTLSRINPRLIYGHITGYGKNNAKTGYDAIIQAEAGFMHMNGEPDGNPIKMPVALVDILAAHHLKEGLLVELINRERTGKGGYVHVSLFDAAVSSLANQATNWLVAGKIPEKMGQEHPNIVPYGRSFKTKDGQLIMLAVGTDKQFKGLCEILGIAEIFNNPDYSTNAARVKNRKTIYNILDKEIARWEIGSLVEALEARKIPCGRINSMDKVFEMKEAQRMILKDDPKGVVKVGLRNVGFEGT
ncbi:MAG: CaiB/BaiF CoA-transferase family protein [Cyclobacteriaceae bacterium]